MIRRGIWLALGAMLGIAGYRRAVRLARTIRPAALPAAEPAAASTALPAARSPGAPPSGRPAVAGRVLRPVRAARAVTAFGREFRLGMEEYLTGYMNRQAGAGGNTLVGQRARAVRAPGTDNQKDGR